MFCKYWNGADGRNSDSDKDCETDSKSEDHKGISWINKSDGGPHEANFLKLDCMKIKQKLGWRPVWNIDRAMEELVRWYRIYDRDGDIAAITNEQIELYLTEQGR